MNKNRLEAFSDGVLAIIVTIMVLEFKSPKGDNWDSLLESLPIFLGYALSFVYVGIFWNSHHHILQAARKINGKVMWANLNLLFWLSLLPFATGWMGHHHDANIPTAFYGVILLLTGLSYWIMEQAIISADGPESLLKAALGTTDYKGLFASLMYAIAIPIALENALIAQAIYIAVAMLYIVPDQRIEKVLINE